MEDKDISNGCTRNQLMFIKVYYPGMFLGIILLLLVEAIYL